MRRRFGPPKENALAAFEYALRNGCDGFEFDVRYTADGHSVLWHDPKIGRKEIAATQYADLRQHCSELSLASLDDVLREFSERAFLDIEIKAPGNEQDVVAQLKAHPPSRGYVVSSFLPDVLLRLHELDDTLPLGCICDDAERMAHWRVLPIQIFLPQYRLVSPALIDEVHERNVQLMTWTVNRARDSAAAGGMGRGWADF